MSNKDDLKILLYTNDLEDKVNEFKGIFDSVEIAIHLYVEDSNNRLAKHLKESGYYISAEKTETYNKYELFYNNVRSGTKRNIGYLEIGDVAINEVY
jgi:pyocin large subunit-like protein